MNQVSVKILKRNIDARGVLLTYDLINAENRPNVHTSVDVTAAIEWIKYDTVFALQLILDDDRLIQLFGNQDSRLSGCSESVNHDII